MFEKIKKLFGAVSPARQAEPEFTPVPPRIFEQVEKRYQARKAAKPAKKAVKKKTVKKAAKKADKKR
jgi:hypothetical protein